MSVNKGGGTKQKQNIPFSMTVISFQLFQFFSPDVVQVLLRFSRC